jgi:hypothetical protein
MSSNGSGEAAALHADFSPVRRAVLEYALAGETIMVFCTGLGAVNGAVSPGFAAPSNPPATTVSMPTVTMDGRTAQVVFSGLAPGFAGLYQVNFVVPPGVGGDVVTTIQIGGVTSNEVTINVAGTYALGRNYTGVIEYRGTGARYQLAFDTINSSSTGFTGQYRVLSGATVADRGSIEVQSTQTVFALYGLSTTTGQRFVGITDTLDAGRSFFGVLYDTDAFEKIQDPDSWYAGFEVVVAPPPPPPPPPPVLPGVSFSCLAVEGALIFATDGQFLGRITSNQFAADSIGNRFGLYGSEFSQTSIFNQFGRYGSQFSSTSAFNEFATSPPIVFINNNAVAFLTVNQFKTPRIDPRALFPCIGR